MSLPHLHRWEEGRDDIGLFWRRCTFWRCGRYELWAYGEWNRARHPEPTFTPIPDIKPLRPNPSDQGWP